MAQSAHFDALVIGAGHNGLVAAALLSKAGLRVKVVEEKRVIGGAVRTETPFARVPGLGTSTGAYLLGLMPPEIMAELEIDLPLVRRDPHYFLPTTGSRYLLFGSDSAAMRRTFMAFFSEKDFLAHTALTREIGLIRDDIAPSWLSEPLSVEDTADRFVRPELRAVFVDLCKKPIKDYLARFGFESDVVQAMYAVTDGFSVSRLGGIRPERE